VNLLIGLILLSCIPVAVLIGGAILVGIILIDAREGDEDV